MIPASSRFHGHGSLRYVFTNGKAIRSERLTIKFIKNTRRSKSRFSVVVSKKVLKSAVGRNRIRRRLYEYARLHNEQLNDVYDIVMIVSSSEFRTMSTPELTSLLDELFQRAQLFKTP